MGTVFRLHGRVPDTGLDCVGLAAAAAAAGGVRVEVPTGYPLRGGPDPARVLDGAMTRVRDRPPRPGDVVLMRTGPGQQHLGVRTMRGMVHADLGLGRVAERPGEPPWPVLGSWRAGE